MASGSRVIAVHRVLPPAASFATPAVIAGASTPAENFKVWQFLDAAAAYLDFYCTIKGYAGGGLTFRLAWSAAIATNNCKWQLAIRRIVDDADDLDTTAKTYAFQSVTALAPTAIGEVSYDNIAFTNGAQMDSLADGESFILRLLRNPADAADTLAATAYLHTLFGYET